MSYFDHNATTPLHPAVEEAMVATLHSDWANPSAPYRLSARVRAKIERSREEVAGYFSADPSTLLFTSGATEAINTFL
ncbi:MAG: aminotransferase class V-fold PLP-dependent enzyme, partial [Opitutales bacterium]